MRWVLFAISCIAVTVVVTAALGRPRPVTLVPPEIGAGQQEREFSLDRVRADVTRLTASPSRLTGSQGARDAAALIRSALEQLPGAEVATQAFQVPVPVTTSAYLEADLAGTAVRVPLHPLWPNLARTCQTPPEGVTGALVDGGTGTDADLAGRQVRHSIVVMDWASHLEWLSVPELGGKALLFRGNDSATAYVSHSKFVSVPADIPRFYVDTADLPVLDRILAAPEPRATVHCRAAWQPATGENILARVTRGQTDRHPGDPDYASIVFHAYYDSISVVPDLAPGAEQACGAAALLELARYFAGMETKRAVYVLFTAGHGQALSGMLQFMSALREALDDAAEPAPAAALLAGTGKPGLFVGLDLSSRSSRYGVFALGRFRGQYEHKLRPKFSVLAGELARYSLGAAAEDDEAADGKFVDCVNLTRGRHWWTYFPYQAPFESEIPVVAGVPGITLTTINDDRRYVDTPGDRPERLRFDLLGQQLLAGPGRRDGVCNIAHALTQWSGPFVSSPLTDAWARLEGRVVWLDQERNYVPNEPLANAMVFLKTQRGDKTLMGTRGIPAVMTDSQGRFCFDGLIQMTGNNQFRNCLLEAYGVASEQFMTANAPAMAQYVRVLTDAAAGDADSAAIVPDGSILFAVDMARANDYPWRIELRREEQHLNLVCFPCSALTLAGLTDPRGYLPLTDLSILEAATLAPPFQFGQSASDSPAGDDIENMATLWADPSVRLMLTLGLGFQEKRLVLINNTAETPRGRGFVLEDLRTVPTMVMQGARDMWLLDDSRIAKLDRHGVSNPRLATFHTQAEEHLEQAEAALVRNDYRAYRMAAERAWALEGKAYGEILSVINNMIRGVLFYLALLLPFSYCLERLIIASETIKRRIIWICAIFAVCFLILALAHPAFRFTLTPFLVLLAFIIVALVVTVSVLIVSRMDSVLQERKRMSTGRHDDQLNLGGIAVRAVDLGISNIRRRPQRGFLTGLTVVTVTFILLSFISVVPAVSISRLRHPEGEPVYRGLLARDRVWGALPVALYSSIRRSFSEAAAAAGAESASQATVAARAWFFSDRSGKLSQIDLSPVTETSAEDIGPPDAVPSPSSPSSSSGTVPTFTAVSLLCLEHTEPEVTGVDQALVAGRWFETEDEVGVILPKHVAIQLGFGLGDIGALVRVFGQDLPIVGIIDQERFDAICDIDGEPLTPVNFVLQQQRQAEQASDEKAEADTLEEYVHYPSDQTVILPFRFGHRLGATIRSIAVRAHAGLDLDQEAQGYAKRSNLTILACDGTDVTLYAALNTSQLSAAWQIVVPLFLGFIMVLATMLGSVYERRGEIFVYNSVGLSPGSVAALFLAESSVYAVLGAALGYLLGQVAAQVMQATGWLAGVTLNYTAGSAVLVTVLTMAIVLISTLYPAQQAFHAAIPDVEKETDQEGPDGGEGDSVRFFLPFVSTPTNVLGMQAYMHEFLSSIEGVTIGQLAIGQLRAAAEEQDSRVIPTLAFRAWLAPFDLGISHDVLLRLTWRAERGVYQYHLSAARVSGDHQNWRRLMPRFVLALRKQLLLWRLLPSNEIARYQTAGEEIFRPA